MYAELHRAPLRISLCPMRLRTDLLKYLTMDDIAEVALANVHRFKPEPNFAKTGVGSLLPATPEDRAQEQAHNTELIQKLLKRQQDDAAKHGDNAPQ